MTNELLSEIIDSVAVTGKGILAADESTGTIGKRFDSINVENTEKNRSKYRSILCSTPNLGEYISGIILFEETLSQKDDKNVPLTQLLQDQNITIGVKVDKGLTNLPFFGEEKVTEGLDKLSERLKKYKELGARFTKWRSVFSVSPSTPSQTAIKSNAEVLARYAAIAQSEGMVPIVEPEILMDGTHTLQRCAEVSEEVFKKVFEALNEHKVKLEYIILKPNMVIPGKACDDQSNPETIAEATYEVLQRSVPKSVPSINFLSGGQNPIESTVNLNAINNAGNNSWQLSFSYGRALQEPCIKTWHGRDNNVKAAQDALFFRAKLNGAASTGTYNSSMEKE